MSTTISDELLLPKEVKKSGISHVIRKGSLQDGFTIEILIHDQSVFLPVKKDWNSTLSTLEKKLTERNKKALDKSKKISYEVELIVNSVLLDNQAWVMARDLKIKQSGDIIEQSSSNDVNNNNGIDIQSTTEPKKLSIANAIRTHSGLIETSGLISTITEPYSLTKREKFKCSSCNTIFGRDDKINILDPPRKNVKCSNCDSIAPIAEHEYVDAKSLRVQTDDNSIDNTQESLRVVVFGEDTKHIQIGEKVTIEGDMAVEEDIKNKQFHTVLLAKRIKYEDRKKLELTFEDIKALKKFRAFENYEARLISMFAPNMIGYDEDKLTILLSSIGAPTYLDDKKHQIIRGRINVLLIGPPGSGKTVLLMEAMKLRITSKFVSGKNTTGPSLTVMVLSDDGKRTLYLGAAARATLGFLGINEFDKLSAEDQDCILEVAEEGICNVNKFADVREVPAQTTIIVTANPKEELWTIKEDRSDGIDRDELPFKLRTLSRFDLVRIIRDTITLETDSEYAYNKTYLLSKHRKVDYPFLRKLIEYARRIEPVLTFQAEAILNDFWIQLRNKIDVTYFVDKRTLENIHRVAKAFARMYLSNEVDDKIAYRTIEFMNGMFKNFNLDISRKRDPSVNAYKKVIEFLKEETDEDRPIALKEAIERTCLHDRDMATYIGRIFDQSKNRRYRDVYEAIRDDYPQVIKVGIKPLKVYWKKVSDDDSTIPK